MDQRHQRSLEELHHIYELWTDPTVWSQLNKQKLLEGPLTTPLSESQQVGITVTVVRFTRATVF
jgi:hypothetical protein